MPIELRQAVRPVGVVAAIVMVLQLMGCRAGEPDVWSPTTLAAGDGHTCAVDPAGTVWCWGNDEGGQLGNGNQDGATKHTPVAVDGGRAFTAVSAGERNTCALDGAGTAWCWGSGFGYAPAAVTGGHTFTAITAGAHPCALDRSGHAWCWGEDVGAERGLAPVAVTGGHTFTAISRECGLDPSGQAWCWGGSNLRTDEPDLTPARVAPGHTFTAISGECGLDPAGHAWCWGEADEEDCQLCLGTEEVAALPGQRTFTAIDGGPYHSCALTAGGQAWCWGDTEFPDALGHADDYPSPGPVSGQNTFTTISAGSKHSCAVDITGQAWCWGDDDEGQLGDDDARTTTRVKVAGGHTFSQISAGGVHSCALDTRGAAWCWGSDRFGQIGGRHATPPGTPTPTAGGHTFTTVTAGGWNSCALDTTGTAWCWGNNAGPEQDPGRSRYEPEAVPGGHTFTTITAGENHQCAVATDGQAWCWGGEAASESGALGDGHPTGTATPLPVPVAGGHTFRVITAGSRHTCALDTAGTGWCWGDGESGALGDGDISTPIKAAPVQVAGGHTFATITAAQTHTCALDTTGKAFCWGWGGNSDGVLGDADGNTDKTEDSPVAVAGGHSYTAIAASAGRTCTLDTTGAAWCWGLAPQPVAGGHTFTAVSSGTHHTCALDTTGRAWCWSSDSDAAFQHGELGDGDLTEKQTYPPVAVAGARTFRTPDSAGPG